MESQIGRDVGAAVGQEIPAEATDAMHRAQKMGAPQEWKRAVPLAVVDETSDQLDTVDEVDDLAQRAAALAIPASKKIAVAVVVAQKRPAPQKDPATKQAAALALQADVAQLAASLATPVVVATPMIAQKPIVVAPAEPMIAQKPVIVAPAEPMIAQKPVVVTTVAVAPPKIEADLDETSHNLTPVEQDPVEHTDTVTAPADTTPPTDTVEPSLTPIEPADDDATASMAAIMDDAPTATLTRASVAHPVAEPAVSLTTKKPSAPKTPPVRLPAEDLDATSPRLGVVPDEDPAEVTAVGRKPKKDPYGGKPRPIAPPRPGRSGKVRDLDADATGPLTSRLGRVKEKGDAAMKSKSSPILPVGTVVGWGQRRPEPWKERPVSSARRRAVALAASFTMVAGLVAGGPAAMAAMPADGTSVVPISQASLGGQVESNALPWAIGAAAVVVVAGVAIGAVVVRRRRGEAGDAPAATAPGEEEQVPLARRE